ncbi:MAG: polyprenyl synthetase family protein [Bacteroidetes bacterium]|nr:polyprenyl synthetase family protein [Bacteroidota bacterium]MDA0937332.1 polyprenyl synthetase family protein [Bacteroidota bacterium]MDA1344800.1 polyprenyl synthetase family protein [Bacteroidota bacterium]
MKAVEQIKAPIYEEMELFEKKFSASMSSNVALINRITHFIVNRKGKQMRPMFVFLVAKMLGKGKVTERVYRGASVIELIHTATLVHDDVIDDSNQRRGFFSVNALWKNKIAVLVGDFLLSKGQLLTVEHEDFDLLKIISVAVREMSQGELLQIEKSRHLDITEEVYYEIIRQKTATLLATCCEMGAQSVNAPEDDVLKMRAFGEAIGMAFQIKDDLFDYGTSKIGKPLGIDIKEQKMTLPLIHALRQAPEKERKAMIHIVKNKNNDKKAVNQLIERVKQLGGLDFAVVQMKQYQEKALAILAQYPQSEYKNSLELMVNYVIDRKH